MDADALWNAMGIDNLINFKAFIIIYFNPWKIILNHLASFQLAGYYFITIGGYYLFYL